MGDPAGLVMVKIQTYDFLPEIASYGIDRMLVRILSLQAEEGGIEHAELQQYS